MKLTCPVIAVKNISVSRAFYENILHQRVVLDLGANITFDGGFALQTADIWAEFLHLPESEIRFGGNDAELYFEEEDFAGFVRHLRSFENIRYRNEVTEYPWGQKSLRFYDPDEHIIEVGETMESVIRRCLLSGMTPEETFEKTRHPPAMIRECLEELKRNGVK